MNKNLQELHFNLLRYLEEKKSSELLWVVLKHHKRRNLHDPTTTKTKNPSTIGATG
jgi:hypothetical protein